MPKKPTLDWCCVAAVNNDAVASQNLAMSPALRADSGRLTILRDQPSASIAYNAGLDATEAEIIVFAHQDVYLPAGWDDKLARHLEHLDQLDPNWAVSALFGVTRDGRYAGRVWSTGLGREVSASVDLPVAVASIDELAIILKRSSGLRFDENLPGFHLYGTDIVQTALAAGYGAFVIDAPVVHNCVPAVWRRAYMRPYNYMLRKWHRHLPIRTTCSVLSYRGWVRVRWRTLRWAGVFANRDRLRAEAERRPRRDPVEIARSLGYE